MESNLSSRHKPTEVSIIDFCLIKKPEIHTEQQLTASLPICACETGWLYVEKCKYIHTYYPAQAQLQKNQGPQHKTMYTVQENFPSAHVLEALPQCLFY